MRNTYNAVLMVMALLAWTGVSHAQDKPVETVLPSASNDNGARALMQFAANNDVFDRALADTAKTVYHRQIEGCQAADQTVRQLPTPYGGITFPAATPNNKFPAPINGVWVEHVKIRGCGQVYQVNLLSLGRASTPPLLLSLLPGETISDPGQQGNVVRAASQAIRKADSTCSDDPRAIYTRMLGYKQADGSLGKSDLRNGWFEEWTFKFCQKVIPAQIAFVPDGRGGFDIKTRIPGETPPPATSPAKPAQNPVPAAPEKTQQTPAQ